MALAAKQEYGVAPIVTDGKADGNTIVPVLFDKMFPDWFAGVAFAAVGIGALVPAAIMSIAAANLFSRNIYKEYLKRDATPRQEATASKIASLVVKVGAVACILFLDPQFAIDLQLIGGVLILQTLPSIAIGLYTRWFHPWALVSGLLAGLAIGIAMLYQIPNPNTGKLHFGGSAYKFSEIGLDSEKQIYVGFVAVIVNLLVAIVVTAVLRRTSAPAMTDDATSPDDYFVDRSEDAPPPAAATEPAGVTGL
jgi:SSS family solute:Na+ symporter